MAGTAVTPEAPAVSAVEQSAAAPAVTRHADAEFLPSDKQYMLTGEMPAEEKPAVAPKKEKAAAAGQTEDGEGEGAGDDTAAASEAASTQDGKTKTPATSESRWAKLSRENRELREKLARAEGKAEGAATRDTPQTPQPAAAAPPAKLVEPKIDDVDPKTGQPKYANFTEYLAALRKYDRDTLLAEIDGKSKQTDQQRAASEADRIIEQTINQRVDAIRKTHTDYDEVLAETIARKDEHGRDAFFYTKGSPIDGFLLDSDVGHEVMYYIGKNWDATKHIFARDANGKYLLNPIRQVRELAKIENKLGGSSSSSSAAESKDGGDKSTPAKPISQAPRPPHQTSGKGAVSKDAIAQAVDEGDQDTYMREQNARDLERRKRGK